MGKNNFLQTQRDDKGFRPLLVEMLKILKLKNSPQQSAASYTTMERGVT